MDKIKPENYAEIGEAFLQQIEFFDGILIRMLMSYNFYCSSYTVLGQLVEWKKQTMTKTWHQPIMQHGKFSIHPITKQSFGWRTWKPENIIINKNVDIGAGCEIFGHFGVIFGENAQIGGGCMIYSANTINQQFAPVIIGKNACIGANSVILPGGVIKENEMIRALSVVYYNDRLKETIIKNR